jgi:small-conductance mechanosensitive channel
LAKNVKFYKNDMQRTGKSLISYKQYRTTDLFLFAVILIAFELIIHFAFIAYNGDFTFSPMLPIVLLIMIRWGWQAAFYAAGDGILYCLLNMSSESFSANYFAVYAIGNLFVMAMLLAIKFIGSEKITKFWYTTLLFVIGAWLLVVLGRATVAACFGYNFVSVFLGNLFDIISLAMAIILILVFRRLDGMLVNQKSYLLKLEKERKEQQKRDTFGEDGEPIEIDEESLSILNRTDNLY